MCLGLTYASKPRSRNFKRSRIVVNGIGLNRMLESVSDCGRWREIKPAQWLMVIVPGRAPKHIVILGCSKVSHGIKVSDAPSGMDITSSPGIECLDEASKLPLPSFRPASA